MEANFRTEILNDLVQKSDLSLKAKGLFLVLTSLDNDISFEKVVRLSKDGKSDTTTALHELESKGFVSRNRERGINGQVKGQNWELDVHGSLV